MEQLLNDLQVTLDQLKSAAGVSPVEPAVDALRTVVEAQLVSEGWVKPSQPVNVPVVGVDSESETPEEDASAEDVNEVSGN